MHSVVKQRQSFVLHNYTFLARDFLCDNALPAEMHRSSCDCAA